MLTLGDIFLLAVLLFGISYWWQARGYKALALSLADRRCQELDLQLLDQSVALEKMRLVRGQGGGLYWQRTYGFEFSSTGVERYRGSLVLLANRLQGIDMDVHVTH